MTVASARGVPLTYEDTPLILPRIMWEENSALLKRPLLLELLEYGYCGGGHDHS